jgi:hypothetical protein
MRCLLVRIGVDQSVGGGSWNAPIDSKRNEFAYVAIPETRAVYPGMEKPYDELIPTLAKFGVALPSHLRGRNMHLDPDFDHLTYGDQGERAKQLKEKLGPGDRVMFYCGLKDVHARPRLIYAIIGILTVRDIILAADVADSSRYINAHSRRILGKGAQDIIVRGLPGSSGRIECCLPIGEWRNRAYRVRSDILQAWGGLSVNDGYLQRSARLPEFLDPVRFLKWLDDKKPTLVQSNN